MTTAKEYLIRVTQDEWGVCDPRDRSTIGVQGHYSVALSTGDDSEALVSLGHRGGAVTTGNDSFADVQGYQAYAVSSGQGSQARTHGDKNVAIVFGLQSAALAEGTDSLAVAWGDQATAQGDYGCWLLLTERASDGSLVHLQMVQVDGVTIRPRTPYRLRDGIVMPG